MKQIIIKRTVGKLYNYTIYVETGLLCEASCTHSYSYMTLEMKTCEFNRLAIPFPPFLLGMPYEIRWHVLDYSKYDPLDFLVGYFIFHTMPHQFFASLVRAKEMSR